MENLCELTKERWRAYITGDKKDKNQSIGKWMDKDCTIIGTGKHEFYKNLAELEQSLHKEIIERKDVKFQLDNIKCEQVQLSEKIVLVYGEMEIWWESKDRSIVINMDSRFSIVYRKEGNGWKVVHLHQSMPNMEQKDGEYYPKTLLSQIKEEQQKSKSLMELAERDALTGLINFRAFQENYQTYVQENDNCWLFIIDVDNFKYTNDTYGHIVGNRVLQKIASILRNTAGSNDMVCRMGGDEFIILCSGLDTEEKANNFISSIQKQMLDASQEENVWNGISIGKKRVTSTDDLSKTLEVADRNMYKAKKRRNTHL